MLEKLGCELVFWGVTIKPGFPLVFGRFGSRARSSAARSSSACPGNPVSAMVTFEEFVRPALRKLAGHPAWFRPRVEAVLGDALRKAAGRLHFVRVRLERRDGQVRRDAAPATRAPACCARWRWRRVCSCSPPTPPSCAEEAVVQVQVLDEDFLAAADAGL